MATTTTLIMATTTLIRTTTLIMATTIEFTFFILKGFPFHSHTHIHTYRVRRNAVKSRDPVQYCMETDVTFQTIPPHILKYVSTNFSNTEM